jgi:hypothetical protein
LLPSTVSRLALSFVLAVASCGGEAPPPARPGPAPSSNADLRDPEAFAGIADPQARSKAIFVEASKVLLHPRCVNCHPHDDQPRQRNLGLIHDPPVVRGPADRGAVGLECTSCHQEKNVEGTRVPGAHDWHLAPREMVWLGRSPGAICKQIKDPARNGNRTLAQIVEHSAHDGLVAWGWAPGADRTPAPGTQARVGALMDAWAKTGAACPDEIAGGKQ